MNAHQGRLRVYVAHDESDSGFPAAFDIGRGIVCVADGACKVAFKAEDAKLPPAGGEVGLGNFFDSIHAVYYKRVRVERCDLRHPRAVVRRGSRGFQALPAERLADNIHAGPNSRARQRASQGCVPDGAIAQLGERCNRTAEVVGSIPTSSTNPFSGLRFCVKVRIKIDVFTSTRFAPGVLFCARPAPRLRVSGLAETV